MFAIQFNPNFLESLKNIQLPISSIDDLTGRDTTSVAVFSDYGPATTQFQTYAFYIIDWNTSGLLASLLKTIKAKHGCSERTINYEGRKDRQKKAAFREWIEAVRNWPGLLYIVAVDRRGEHLPIIKAQIAKLKKEFSDVGLPDYNVYSLMFGALTFLATLSRYLKAKHKVAWITDRECIIDTPARQDTLMRTLGYHAELMMGKPLSDFRVLTHARKNDAEKNDPEEAEFNDVACEVLSVADVAASSVGNSLTVDEGNSVKFICRDPEAIDMLQEISKFRDITEYKIEHRPCCPLLTSIFLLKYTADGHPYYQHDTLTLKYDPRIDPLLNVSKTPE